MAGGAVHVCISIHITTGAERVLCAPRGFSKRIEHQGPKSIWSCLIDKPAKGAIGVARCRVEENACHRSGAAFDIQTFTH